MKVKSIPIGLLALSTIAFAAPDAGRRQEPSNKLSITGDIPANLSLSADDLDKLPKEEASEPQEDGSSVKLTGVLLRAVLEKAGAPTGKSLRGKGLATYILAKARDGYEVVFTPAELDPTFGNERVLVVYKRNGRPLFNYQGPFRLFCPNDKAGARSVRMLESIEIVRLRK